MSIQSLQNAVRTEQSLTDFYKTAVDGQGFNIERKAGGRWIKATGNWQRAARTAADVCAKDLGLIDNWPKGPGW